MTNNQFDSLETVTRDICIANQDFNATQFVPVLRTVIRILEQFNVHLGLNVSSRLLQMQDNNTIILPDDVMSVMKVGYCLNKEQIVKLGQKKVNRPSLAKAPNEEPCTCSTVSLDDILATKADNNEDSCTACTFHNSNLFGNSYNRLYGYTAKQNQEGVWSHQLDGNRLVFDSGHLIKKGEYYLIESNNAYGPDEFKMIPRKMYPAIRARAMQWLNQGAGEYGAASQMNHDFKIEWRMLVETYDTFTLEDWITAIRGQYTYVPKD